jgi:hypothetical protein
MGDTASKAPPGKLSANKNNALKGRYFTWLGKPRFKPVYAKIFPDV